MKKVSTLELNIMYVRILVKKIIRSLDFSNLGSKRILAVLFLHNAPYSNQNKRENRQSNGKFKASMLSLRHAYAVFEQSE